MDQLDAIAAAKAEGATPAQLAESLELRDLTTGETVFKSRARGPLMQIGLEHVEHYSSESGIQVFKDHQYELVSVYDKDGIVDLCRVLESRDVEILSSGGTARLLGENGIRITRVADYTGSPEMLDAAVKSSKLDTLLDAVLSVHDLGIFKPHPSVYQLAVDTLGVAPRQVSFQSSNAWDAAAAATFGFRVAWVNRFGQAEERLPDQPDVQLRTLSELPAVVLP